MLRFNDLYLIHSHDYLTHLDDKTKLFILLRHLTDLVEDQPATRNNKELRKTAQEMGEYATDLFLSWGIPTSYLVTRDPAELEDLAMLELTEPEDCGFFLDEDGLCDYDYEDYDDYDEDYDDYDDYIWQDK